MTTVLLLIVFIYGVNHLGSLLQASCPAILVDTGFPCSVLASDTGKAGESHLRTTCRESEDPLYHSAEISPFLCLSTLLYLV